MLRWLKGSAQAAGFPTERWTLQRIQKTIEREFHVGYHPNYVSHSLTAEIELVVASAFATSKRAR
jgi:transposase